MSFPLVPFMVFTSVWVSFHVKSSWKKEKKKNNGEEGLAPNLGHKKAVKGLFWEGQEPCGCWSQPDSPWGALTAPTRPLLWGGRRGPQQDPSCPGSRAVCHFLLRKEARSPGWGISVFEPRTVLWGAQSRSPDNSSELAQQSFFFFLPSKVEICSTDKSNAFRENNSKAFLVNSSPSEHQATIVPRYSQLGMTS